MAANEMIAAHAHAPNERARTSLTDLRRHLAGVVLSAALVCLPQVSAAQAAAPAPPATGHAGDPSALVFDGSTNSADANSFQPPVPLPEIPFDSGVLPPTLRVSLQTHAGLTFYQGGAGCLCFAQFQETVASELPLATFLEIYGGVGGTAASGVSGSTFIAGGTAVDGEGTLGVGFSPDADWGSAANILNHFVLRTEIGLDEGYRINVQPLLRAVSDNPLPLLDDAQGQIGSHATYPVNAGHWGLSIASRVGQGFAQFQFAVRWDRFVSTATPWLEQRGTEAAGNRQLQTKGDRLSLGAAWTPFTSEDIDWMAQLSGSLRRDVLDHPVQDTYSVGSVQTSRPYTQTWNAALGIGFIGRLAPRARLSALLGMQYASTELLDVYQNRPPDISAWTVFLHFSTDLWLSSDLQKKKKR